jgi:hypothetical protein
VTASLVLPEGLRLGRDTTTGVQEVSEKALGNNGTVQADEAANTSWLVEPTGTIYGTLTYQVSFKTRDFGSRQISRNITIPATPFKQFTASEYRMIGFPFNFDPVLSNNGDPSTVVNGLSRPLDEPVAFYKYDPTINDYLPPVTQLETGIGYFYRPNLSRTIYGRGLQPVPGQAETGNTTFTNIQQKQVTLNPGWNMISNPYLYDVPVRFLRFVPASGNTTQSQAFPAAVSSNLVRGGLFFYDPATGGYDILNNLTDSLRPWESYWMFVNNKVILIYPLSTQRGAAIIPEPGGTEPPTRKRGTIANGSALISSPTMDDWRLRLVAKRGSNQTDGATVIGVTNGNVSENDRLVPKPPMPISDYVYVGVVHPNVKGRFAKDIQTGRGTKTWEVEVRSDKDGPVTLSWPNIGTMPRRLNLSVKNLTNSSNVSLRGTSSLTVNVRKGEPTRLVFTAKQQASQQITISGLRMAGSGTRSEGRSFVFNVNREAQVTMHVKTLTGKVLATVASGRSATPGENRFSWSGRSQSGAALPPGAYMVEVTARGEDGEAPVTLRLPFQSIQ